MESLNLTIYKELYPYAEVIDSSEIFKSMKFHAIKTGMLTPEGEAIPYICRKQGDGLKDSTQLRICIFNRDYAIRKLAADLKLIIAALDATEFQALMSSVYYHE